MSKCLSKLLIRSIPWLLLVIGVTEIGLSGSLAQAPTAEPVVARIEMRLAKGEETLDLIKKGDLLTVLEDRGDNYLIRSVNGIRGVVSKVNAVKIAESSDIYTELIKENPKEGRLYTLRASAWWALQDREKAVADFDRAIAMGYDQPHAYSSRGLFLSSLGEYEKAIADFSQAITKGADDGATLINRAAAHMNLGKFNQAIDDYSAALKKAPTNSAILLQRAIGYKLLNKPDDAIADYSRAIQISADDIQALLGRGFIYFQKGDHNRAIADFSEVIRLNPKAAVAYNNRGYNYQLLGKHKEALADFDEAISLAPEYGLAFQNRAWLLAICPNEKLRNPSEAIAAGKKACELSQFQNASDLAAMAAAFASAGDFKAAIGWQEKIVEMVDNSQKEFARKILERYKTDLAFDPEFAKNFGTEGQIR